MRWRAEIATVGSAPMSESSSLPLFAPPSIRGRRSPTLLRQVARTNSRAPAITAPSTLEIPHGTTVVAIRFAGGVIMAGDRRATAGYMIASRRIEKVFPADDYSGVSIAGAAGPAIEMVKLFQVQLEHYEKVQGETLSLEGKANQLGQLVRANLPAAMQGFAVVPLFAGFDLPASGAGSSATTSPAAATRSSTSRPRARAASTPATGSRPAGARGSTPTTRSASRSRRCSRPPTRTSPPAAPTSCAASSRPSR